MEIIETSSQRNSELFAATIGGLGLTGLILWVELELAPVASAYLQDGRACRDFLASYVNGRNESWLHGSACQIAHGRWEIHTLKPWTQS